MWLQAFATQTVRMLLPHLGVLPEFFRLCKCCCEALALDLTIDAPTLDLRMG